MGLTTVYLTRDCRPCCRVQGCSRSIVPAGVVEPANIAAELLLLCCASTTVCLVWLSCVSSVGCYCEQLFFGCWCGIAVVLLHKLCAARPVVMCVQLSSASGRISVQRGLRLLYCCSRCSTAKPTVGSSARYATQYSTGNNTQCSCWIAVWVSADVLCMKLYIPDVTSLANKNWLPSQQRYCFRHQCVTLLHSFPYVTQTLPCHCSTLHSEADEAADSCCRGAGTPSKKATPHRLS
jgi:hypothetical protein